MEVSRGVVDTSLFIAQKTGRRVTEELVPQELAISVITIGELRAGVLAAQDTETRDKRLNTLQAALSVEAIPITVAVAAAWARLRLVLRENGRRMPVNDSWIAATAISLGIPVVTQDRGLRPVDGLEVIIV